MITNAFTNELARLEKSRYNDYKRDRTITIKLSRFEARSETRLLV